MITDDLFATVYLNVSGPSAAVDVLRAAGLTIDQRGFGRIGGAEIDVRGSDERSSYDPAASASAYRQFPVHVEVDYEGSDRQAAAHALEQVLAPLRAAGLTYLVECEFEDLLPKGGVHEGG